MPTRPTLIVASRNAKKRREIEELLAPHNIEVLSVTDFSDVPEVIEDGISGILEPAGSVEAMGRRAGELLRDPVAFATMRRAALARAAEFSADRVVPQYEALYTDAVG